MDLNDFGNSKYLAGTDVGERGILVTIKAVTKQRVGQGVNAKDACIIYFHETMTPDNKPIKPMVCNKTNASRIAQMTGQTRDVDRTWPGAKVVVYYDPNVEFGGKLVGGLRVRAPRNQPARPTVQQPQPVRQVTVPAEGGFVPPDAGIAFPNVPNSVPGETVPYGYDEQGGLMDGQGEDTF